MPADPLAADSARGPRTGSTSAGADVTLDNEPVPGAAEGATDGRNAEAGGMSSLSRRTGAVLLTGPPKRPVEAGESFVESGSDPSGEANAAPLPGPSRPERRDGALVEDPGDREASVEPDPVDPADPVVSANATGIDPTTEPTPKATARAPTRPT